MALSHDTGLLSVSLSLLSRQGLGDISAVLISYGITNKVFREKNNRLERKIENANAWISLHKWTYIFARFCCPGAHLQSVWRLEAFSVTWWRIHLLRWEHRGSSRLTWAIPLHLLLSPHSVSGNRCMKFKLWENRMCWTHPCCETIAYPSISINLALFFM